MAKRKEKEVVLVCPNCKRDKVNGKCPACGVDSKKTPAMLDSLEECLRLDMPVYKAVQVCGISEKTFYSWIKEDEALAIRMRVAKSFATTLARQSVLAQIAHDGALALKYLERKEKDEFSTKNIVKNEAPSAELDKDEREELKKLFDQNNISVPGFDEDGEFENELG